jgi:hypothetical protein
VSHYPDDYDDREADIIFGDSRRCPAHGCVTSSPNGMFDAPCPECEAAMYADEPWPEDGTTVLDDLSDDPYTDYDHDDDLPF